MHSIKVANRFFLAIYVQMWVVLIESFVGFVNAVEEQLLPPSTLSSLRKLEFVAAANLWPKWKLKIQILISTKKVKNLNLLMYICVLKS